MEKDSSSAKQARQPSVSRICQTCGKPFRVYVAHLNFGAKPQWCSRACRYATKKPEFYDPEKRKVPLYGKYGEGKFALVSPDDYDTVMARRWVVTKFGYPRRMRHGDESPTLMHRLLLNPPEGLHVDHINGDRLDNRRENLRLCTQAENNRNLKKTKRPTTSRYKGVSRSANGKWEGHIRSPSGQKFLGYYACEVEAALAYDAAAKEYFGEFANLNFPA